MQKSIEKSRKFFIFYLINNTLNIQYYFSINLTFNLFLYLAIFLFYQKNVNLLKL